MAAGGAEAEAPAKKARAESKAIGATWGLPPGGPVPVPPPGGSVLAPLTYQGDGVPRSLVAAGWAPLGDFFRE